MFWFVTYTDAKGQEVCKRFLNFNGMWKWLQKYYDEHAKYPPAFCVYSGKCCFDGS